MLIIEPIKIQNACDRTREQLQKDLMTYLDNIVMPYQSKDESKDQICEMVVARINALKQELTPPYP